MAMMACRGVSGGEGCERERAREALQFGGRGGRQGWLAEGQALLCSWLACGVGMYVNPGREGSAGPCTQERGLVAQGKGKGKDGTVGKSIAVVMKHDND
jgi:hypothetical protein